MADLDNIQDIYKLKMTTSDFKKLSSFIYEQYGIKMPDAKQTMLQSRLHKRLRALNIRSFKEYIDYVFSKEGQREELLHMIDEVSTNKTDFFREPAHFDFLTHQLLPEFVSQNPGSNILKAWSAGCSSGEEPYTLAIVLSEFAAKNPGFDFSILGTDISSRILQTAVNAVYPEERINIIPMALKRKYFLRSKDRNKRTVRLVPQIRNKVHFQRLNFMDASYNISGTFDIIFCRNVLIYFDRQTQQNVINRLSTKLKPNGYFFLGHSESITNMSVPLRQVRPTIFTRI